MDQARFEQIHGVFQTAGRKHGADRETYLRKLQREDPDLHRMVVVLLDTPEIDAGGLTRDTLETYYRTGELPTTKSGPPVPEGPALQEGQTLRHYRIAEKLGEGGMGEVWKAVDTTLDREVAIKLLPGHWKRDPLRLERFRHEARTVASLNHPNIVVLHSIEEEAGFSFMTLELISGRSLRSLIPENGLSLREFLDLAVPIADALAAAHAKGVVHRDVKPENVMITDEHRVKVLDFGIAKRVRPDDATGSATRGDIAGTPPYMSPEQLRGEALDIRSDVFSLGVLFYEMAVGSRPFSGTTGAELAAAILRDDPPPPSERRPEYPLRFDALVSRCLEKNPDDRPATAAPVHEELVEMRREQERHALRAFMGDPEPLVFRPRRKGSMPTTVAVLPFLDLSPDEDQEYLCLGLAEDIGNALSRVGGLQVTVASRMDRQSVDPLEMGRLLGVEAILDGSVRRSEDRFRINVRVVQVHGGTQLWSSRFDRPLTDVFAVQDEVAEAVAGHFNAPLEVVKPPREIHPDAYAAYLRGRFFWGKRYEGGLVRALECFGEALAVDPEMPQAHAGRADCFIIMGHYGFMEPRKAYSLAREAVERALAIDPDLAEAHASLGWVTAFYDWAWKDAEIHFDRALALDPSYGTAWEWKGIFLVTVGRREESIRAMVEAQKLDPLSLMVSTILGWGRFETGQEEEAIQILENVLEMDPRFVFGRNVLGLVLSMIGRHDAGVENLERSESLAPGNPMGLSFLGYAYGRAGRTEDADRMLAELDRLEERRYIPSLHRALPHLGAGRTDAALDHLKKAVAARETFFTTFHFSRMFDPLRDDSRFLACLQAMNLSEAR